MGFLHSRCFVGFSEPSPIQREVSWMTRALRKKRIRVDKQGWSGWTLMANCVWTSCFYSLWLKRSENFRPPKASRQSRFNHYVVRLALSGCSTGKTRSALTCTGIIPASSSSAASQPAPGMTYGRGPGLSLHSGRLPAARTIHHLLHTLANSQQQLGEGTWWTKCSLGPIFLHSKFRYSCFLLLFSFGSSAFRSCRVKSKWFRTLSRVFGRGLAWFLFSINLWELWWICQLFIIRQYRSFLQDQKATTLVIRWEDYRGLYGFFNRPR